MNADVIQDDNTALTRVLVAEGCQLIDQPVEDVFFIEITLLYYGTRSIVSSGVCRKHTDRVASPDISIVSSRITDRSLGHRPPHRL